MKKKFNTLLTLENYIITKDYYCCIVYLFLVILWTTIVQAIKTTRCEMHHILYIKEKHSLKLSVLDLYNNLADAWNVMDYVSDGKGNIQESMKLTRLEI